MFEHPRSVMLSAFHDGELSAVMVSEVEQHLSVCGPCRCEYDSIGRAANVVRHLAPVRAPLNLASRVREQIDAEERGMVPVLRGQILRAKTQPGFWSAFGLGTLTTVLLVGVVLLADYRYGVQATSAWIQSTLPDPVLLHETMSSPRVRGGSVGSLPFEDVGQGEASTVLALASIDRIGMVQGLEVIYRSGDEEMLSRALDAVRESGFEPARLGDQTISVNFLYLFTTTEVRPDGRRLSTVPDWRARRRAATEA